MGRHTLVVAFVASVVARARARAAAGGVCRRGRQRRPLRLVIVVALLFLLLTGVATATDLLVGGNGKIAVEGYNGRLLVVNPNGHGLRTIARCAADNRGCEILEPAWSPDGTRLAFVRGFVGGATRPDRMFLYVAAADRAGAKRLASCGDCGYKLQAYGGRLPWSPGGKWIAFSRDAGLGRQSLWVVAAAGGSPHRITDCSARSSQPGTICDDVLPAWSSDGLLLFQRITDVYGSEKQIIRSSTALYTVRSDGSALTRIASGAGPQWSPDAHRIAFDSDPDSIAVANADGSDVHVLFAGARGTGPGAPSWSPDGRKLVFFKTPGRPGHYRAEVWTMNADGSNKERLYRSGCCVGAWAPPIWSPDGRMIAFSADSAGGTFVINADGTGLRRLSSITTEVLSWQQRPRR